jgi:hypothetical protein
LVDNQKSDVNDSTILQLAAKVVVPMVMKNSLTKLLVVVAAAAAMQEVAAAVAKVVQLVMWKLAAVLVVAVRNKTLQIAYHPSSSHTT